MTVPATTNTDSDRAIDAALMQGDLSKLNADQKYSHYLAVCKSLGLNPLTKPFAYLKLPNGKEVLYATRDATDQLRKKHNVSVTDLTTIERGDIYIVIAKVRMGERTDAGTGAVSLAGLRGENLANALMKAETKAKRRATLSICGLGFLDETEAEDIPNARVNPVGIGGAEEYVDVPPPDHPDRLPAGAPDIKPLPKKDARKDYEAMKTEMHAIQDPERLREWGKASADRIATFPLDWQDHMRGHYAAHITALRAAYAGYLANGTAPSRTYQQFQESAWLATLERDYATCQDMADFFEVDKISFNTQVNTVSQDARNEAHRIRQTRLDQLTVVQEPE